MTTLHIEHGITDYTIWRTAFDTFADARRDAGVIAERVSQPVGDAHYIVIGLEFESSGRAEAFLEFLTRNVWSSPSAAPALDGAPRTMILEPVDQPARPRAPLG